MAVQNDWLGKFGYQGMRNVMKYLLSCNHQSQTFAIDGTNAENVQTTGLAPVSINGVLIPSLAADAEYDISAEAAYAAWATSTAYTLNSEVTQVEGMGTKHYVCISAHTSGTLDDEPGVGEVWETYWKRLDKFAVDAAGDVTTDGDTQYYLACVLNDGTLRLFIAYDSDGNLQIPAFDPERYAAIGILTVAASGADATLGTTALTGIGTFDQIVGPIFPDAALVDPN